jgi:hypothetical protein
LTFDASPAGFYARLTGKTKVGRFIVHQKKLIMNTTDSLAPKTLLPDVDVAKILREGEERRAAEKRRREIINSFRRQTERSVSAAVVFFLSGIFQGIAAYLIVSEHKLGDSWWMTQAGFMVALTCYWFYLGLRKLWLSPRDRFMLLLLDELMDK